MALEPARLKVLYNLCNPEEAMERDDQRRADLDARGGRGFLPDDDWATRLSRELQLADAPLFRLISGLPGSGKSTELRRLRDLLQADARGGLLVVLVDAEKALDLRVSIALQDLLVVIVAETERRVVEAEGRSLPGPVQGDTALQRLGARLFGSTASPEKVEVGVGGNKLTLALKPDSSLRSRLERLMKDDAASFLRDVADAMEALQRRAIGAGHQGIVVLVDSLEKLRGMSHNFADVLKSAEDLFGSGAPYLRLPVSAVYTVPVALVLRLSEDVRVLPMIKLRSRDGAPFPPGVEAARDLIRRRIPDADLEEIFGAPIEPSIDRLLRASGGYPREIVKLLRAVLTAGTFPLGEERLTRILSESGDAFRRVAHSHGERAIALLARIHLSKRLIVDDEDRQLLDHLLVNNLVLRYQNDSEWVDVHPALLESGAVSEAIAREQMRVPAEGTLVPVS